MAFWKALRDVPIPPCLAHVNDLMQFCVPQRRGSHDSDPISVFLPPPIPPSFNQDILPCTQERDPLIFDDDWSYEGFSNSSTLSSRPSVWSPNTDALIAHATEVSSIQIARMHSDCQISQNPSHGRLDTTVLLDFTNRCGEKIKAGCTNLSDVVRDVPIPPCFAFFQQLRSGCVLRHTQPGKHQLRYRLHPSSSGNTRCDPFPKIHSRYVPKFSPSQTPVCWYTGLCYRGDHCLDISALQPITSDRTASAVQMRNQPVYLPSLPPTDDTIPSNEADCIRTGSVQASQDVTNSFGLRGRMPNSTTSSTLPAMMRQHCLYQGSFADECLSSYVHMTLDDQEDDTEAYRDHFNTLLMATHQDPHEMAFHSGDKYSGAFPRAENLDISETFFTRYPTSIFSSFCQTVQGYSEIVLPFDHELSSFELSFAKGETTSAHTVFDTCIKYCSTSLSTSMSDDPLHDSIPLRGIFARRCVPRHQNIDVVPGRSLHALFIPKLDVAFEDLVDTLPNRSQADHPDMMYPTPANTIRMLLFDVQFCWQRQSQRSVLHAIDRNNPQMILASDVGRDSIPLMIQRQAQAPPPKTISTGAVPDPTVPFLDSPQAAICREASTSFNYKQGEVSSSWPHHIGSVLRPPDDHCGRCLWNDIQVARHFDVCPATEQEPQLITTSTGAVPDPTDYNQSLSSQTTSRGAVPESNIQFRDALWSRRTKHVTLFCNRDDLCESLRWHRVQDDRQISLQIAESGSDRSDDKVLLFNAKQVSQRPRHKTICSGAVPDPTATTQYIFQDGSIFPIFDRRRPPVLALLHTTSSSGTVPKNNHVHSPSFRGWSEAVYAGGHPAWGRCEIIHMAPNPPFAERCAAATQDNGWLASDEALWFLRLLKNWRSDIAIGPIIQWSPSRDLQHLMAAEDQLQCNNGYLNILLFLVEAHWCAVEIDRRTEPVHVILIQWPQEHHTMVILEVSRILQIPANRMLVTVDTAHEVVTMCGWTILFRWYNNFAMQTCLQPLIHATDQVQVQIDSVLHRAQRYWNRTNAPGCLRRFAIECRRAFMSEYARDQPDTRLPNAVSTVMFVGPQDEYVQEVNQVPRPPTHREREINWLRNMLIQPAWLTNFEVELVLQMTRMQILDRFLTSPLHFDPLTGQLESLVNDLPSIAGYTKVLFFVTLNYHWISISGTQHQNRWMLTAVVPDPRSRDLPPLFEAIAALLETSPDRVHIQAIPMQSPPHLCGWLLLYSLQDHCQIPLQHDATILLQRIAVMPNSRIKTLIFEEALGTWTRHAPHQSLVTFATQIRSYFLAHMDTWSSHHVLHFGGMFPHSAPTSIPASWTAISHATKAKILDKIRSHVQRPYVCPCITRLTAFVEIDRMVEANDSKAIFIAFIKPSPLQWASHFCHENVLHDPCSHDRVTEIVLQVPSRSADLIPPHVEAIIYKGRVQFMRSQVVVTVHDLESGIRIFRTGRNHPTTNLDVGELCSGAFSGWTQATKVLATMGYPIQTKFAVDHDHCVATWYARNFTDSAIAAQPDDVFKLRDECFYYREAPITFQTDVSLGWYLLFCEPVDIITASPPCPAFSNASTAAGLEKQEGQVILDTILKILLLQPKIMVIEEVASLRTHVHFPLILELLNWGNFQVAWQEVLNLDDWLPQSRPRLILIAFRRCSYGLKHFPRKPWQPSPSRSRSLQDSHCLLIDEAIIEITSAPLDFDTAKLYFDSSKIPGATPRSFKDVLRFRLRTPHDRVQCIMASYAYGHEIDADSQSQKGIFGSLLRHQGRLRFLAGPELLWLQGLSVEWQGPLNPRLLNHIIGNAISVPHALIGLFNVLGHFARLEFDSFPHDLFLTAMASRLHAQNSDCIIDVHTGTFAITPKLVPPTEPWDTSSLDIPPLTKVLFVQGNKSRTISVQSGLSVLPVFAYLFSTYETEQISWLPFDRPGLALPIVDTDIFWGAQMMFTLPESFRLCLQEQSFSTLADTWTAVLLPDRMIIRSVTESDTIATLSRALAQECSCPFHLCNHMLTKFDATDKPRQILVARFVEPPVTHLDDTLDGAFLDMGECLQATMETTESNLFLQTCHASGVTDLLGSLGWHIFELQQSRPRSSHRQLTILPNSTQLFVDAVAIRNLVAAHVTTWYIPVSVPPTSNTVTLSLKLWATVIWKGHLPMTTKTDIFANAWHAASSLLGPLIPVRSILRGKRLSLKKILLDTLVKKIGNHPSTGYT